VGSDHSARSTPASYGIRRACTVRSVNTLGSGASQLLLAKTLVRCLRLLDSRIGSDSRVVGSRRASRVHAANDSVNWCVQVARSDRVGRACCHVQAMGLSSDYLFESSPPSSDSPASQPSSRVDFVWPLNVVFSCCLVSPSPPLFVTRRAAPIFRCHMAAKASKNHIQ
jgi:hypothetical protein